MIGTLSQSIGIYPIVVFSFTQTREQVEAENGKKVEEFLRLANGRAKANRITTFAQVHEICGARRKLMDERGIRSVKSSQLLGAGSADFLSIWP